MFVAKYLFYFTDETNSITLYHNMKLHVSTKYVVFLKTLMHTKPTIKLYFCISDRNENSKFYVSLTVHPGVIFVNNQLDEKLFMYVYFYSLRVSGSHVPIIRRIIVPMRHLVYVTLCR